MMISPSKKNELFPFLILFGSFLNVIATFMMLPILALHAMKEFKLTASEVGLVCAIWPAVLCSTTLFFGIIADKFGHRKALKFGLTFQLLSFFLMACSTNISEFVIAQIFFGLGKSFFDTSIKAIFVSSCPSDRLPYFIRMRYLLVNIGCVLGPLVGVFLYDLIGKKSFFISSSVYVFFMLLFFFIEPKTYKLSQATLAITKLISIRELIKLFQDKYLIVWIFSSLIIVFVFGIYESMMPIILSSEAQIINFGYLLSLNGCSVIIIQILLLKYKIFENEYWLTLFGFTGFIFGFIIFSLPIESEYKFLVGTFFFSCGEALLFPQMEIKLNSMSPKNNKATYFGVSEIKQAGFFLGPAIGGFIYEQSGRIALFSSCSILLMISAIFYMKLLFANLTKEEII